MSGMLITTEGGDPSYLIEYNGATGVIRAAEKWIDGRNWNIDCDELLYVLMRLYYRKKEIGSTRRYAWMERMVNLGMLED